MTNWRETGYVPASDDDFSDAELSTQGEQQQVELPEPEQGKEQENGRINESTADGANVQNGAAEKQMSDMGGMGTATNNTVAEDGLVPSCGITRVGKSVLGIGLSGQHEELGFLKEAGEAGEELESQKVVGDARKGRELDEISVVDLSAPDLQEEQDGFMPESGVVGSRVNEVMPNPDYHGESQVNPNTRPSPDPIAGERQDGSDSRVRPVTPRPQTPPNPVRGNSTAASSALSSPPSLVATPPSMTAVRSSARYLGFEVVIPPPKDMVISPDNDVPRYFRSLRVRKPIQKNPYLIEQERYRQTLKDRGVRPVRISEVEEETNGGLGADDSQEGDYVAPPEPGNDESQFVPAPYRRRDEPRIQDDRPVDIYDFGEFPDAASASRDRPRPNGALADGVKRRKVNHTYPKGPHINPPRPHSKPGPSSGNVPPPSSRLQPEVGENGRGTCDLPEDLPQRQSRTPLAQTSPNGSPSKKTPQQLGAKRRGILSLLDSSSDIESTPSRRGRPRPISPASEDDTPRAPHVRAILDLSSSSSEEEPTPSEDESQEVRRLQRKTAGVLPASWWKLDKQKQPSSTKDPHRERRRSSTPAQDLTPRPGVARARISSRPKSSVGGTFHLGDESDDSSGPANIQPQVLPSGRSRTSHRQTRTEVIELDDDVIEDDRIDRMLPAIQRNSWPRKRKQRDPNRLPRAPQGIGASRHSGARNPGSGSSRLRQPKITSHVATRKKSTKRKPKAPQLGIIDAVRHHRTMNPGTSPPAFLKFATRSARERRSKGRQSPTKKVFRLGTAADTQEVQSVLRDWREGTIAIRAYESSNEIPPHGIPKTRPSSPHTKKSPAGPLGLDLGLSLPGASASRRPRAKQSTLTNVMRTRPLLSRINDIHRSRPKIQKGSSFQTVPTKQNTITHRQFFMPEPAQFETEEPPSIAAARLRTNSRRGQRSNLADLLRATARKNPNLGRFMEDEDLTNPLPRPLPIARSGPKPVHTPTTKPARPPRARRKRTPTRIDVDTIERRQPPPEDRAIIDDADIESIPEPIPSTATAADKPVLVGLLPHGSKYTLSFDTIPLKPGTVFNSETFIGSGGLSKALNSKLQKFNQSSTFRFGDKFVRWGVYQDSMAAEFESIMEGIADFSEKAQEEGNDVEAHMWAAQAYSFYAFFSNYLFQVISFSDSIDLISFGQRVLQAINVCCDRALSVLGGSTQPNLNKASTRLALQLHVFGLVFTFQMYKLASEDPDAQERLELIKSIRRLGHQLLGRLLRCGFDVVRECYEDQRQSANYERGIGLKHYVVEAWVIAIHTLDQVRFQDINFWQLLNNEFRLADIDRALDIRMFEKHWRRVWSILPLYQFDEFGVAQGVVRDGNLSENWTLLRVLVGRPLKVYNANTAGHFGTINAYCRTLYARCHHLIAKWGWLNADIIIPVLYEFFACKSLANLRNEDTYGSPDFLQRLDNNPSLEIKNSDPCFHLLLKIVGLGLHAMKTTMPVNKIGNLVNRLMPNHGRQYPKDEDLRVENLTALRNHHDLLSTLWWASPPKCRPPLEAIRYLVDPEMSHQQACIVSIRTWSNMIRFQLHSGEGLDILKSLMEWFDDFTSSTLNQHHTARSEAEKHFHAAKELGDTELSEDVMEDSIRQNQRQLEGILIDALKSLGAALAGLKGQIQSAIAIFTKASTANILNSHNRVSTRLVFEALDLIQQYLVVSKSIDNSNGVAVQASEDSQDYGDWSGFDDIVIKDEQKAAAEHLSFTVYEALHRMLSNCFGADKQPEESLLVRVVDTWALVVGFLVRHGLKNWDVYLDNYNPESWSSLRDTEQTRKFTAYFIPKIIQSGAEVYETNKTTFISFWLKTLVERESLLKFQNEYTATLLNCDPTNPILANPPFVREVSGEFKITLADFRSRRLSLISTIVANMREFYEQTRNGSPQRAAALKLEYSEMLKSMMKSMKEIYQEIHAKSTSGAYVEFVQQVVEYLQQHSIDMVAIDRFFTDSTVFPLPSADPTYVVGRLKNYGLKLSHQRVHKQLTSFFQSVCERAAIDGQQDYLVHQLTTALSGNLETGNPRKPTLRALFMEAIFPAYIECSLSEPAGWVLAAPLLKAAGEIVRKMPTDIDSSSPDCVRSVTSMLLSLTEGMRIAIASLPTPSGILSTPTRLAIFTLMLEVVSRAIPILDYLALPVPAQSAAFEPTAYILKQSAYLSNIIRHREAELPMDVHMLQRHRGGPHEGTKIDALSALKCSLSREWKCRGGVWHVVRGASSREALAPAFEGGRGEEAGRRDLVRRAIECLRVAARSEMFGGVAWTLDRRVWEEENFARGRRRGVGIGRVYC